QGLEIHQLSAAGIGDIGDVNATQAAAGQLPNQKGIDVAKNHIARLGLFASTFYVFENPADLETAEIRGEWQASPAAKTILPTSFRKLADVLSNPRILPHERVRDGLASFAIPYDSGLTLVGDSDG